MYGTVMIGRSSTPIETLREVSAAWKTAIGTDAGFIDERVLQAGDGRIVMCVRFKDEAAYKALADNPAQNTWWAESMAPLLDGEPEWIDGTWKDI
jgi:hypothetical protein